VVWAATLPNGRTPSQRGRCQ